MALSRLVDLCFEGCEDGSCAAELAAGCRADVVGDELEQLEACIVEVELCDCAGLVAETCAPVCDLILD